MSAQHQNRYPKLHNAMWPGLVGKGSPGAEPCIGLYTMLDLTTQAEVNGGKIDGVDIFFFHPHININIKKNNFKVIAHKNQTRIPTESMIKILLCILFAT